MDGGRWKGYIEQKKKIRELILKKEKKEEEGNYREQNEYVLKL